MTTDDLHQACMAALGPLSLVERVELLTRAVRHLQALEVSATTEWITSVPPSQRTAAAADLGVRLGLTTTEVSTVVDRARDLAKLPGALSALASGDLGASHLDAVRSGLRGASSATSASVDAALALLPSSGSPAPTPQELRRVVRESVGAQDPRAAVRRAELVVDERSVTYVERRDGGSRLTVDGPCLQNRQLADTLRGLAEHGWGGHPGHDARLLDSGEEVGIPARMFDALYERVTGLRSTLPTRRLRTARAPWAPTLPPVAGQHDPVPPGPVPPGPVPPGPVQPGPVAPAPVTEPLGWAGLVVAGSVADGSVVAAPSPSPSPGAGRQIDPRLASTCPARPAQVVVTASPVTRHQVVHLAGHGLVPAMPYPAGTTVHLAAPLSVLRQHSDDPLVLAGLRPLPAAALGTQEWAVVLDEGTLRVAKLAEHDALDRWRHVYTPRRALRRYVQRRDQHCRFPGCLVPALQCQLDHVVAWEHGGRTTRANLVCLCAQHHQRTKHSELWALTGDAEDTLWWVGPGGRAVASDPPPVFAHRVQVVDEIALAGP